MCCCENKVVKTIGKYVIRQSPYEIFDFGFEITPSRDYGYYVLADNNYYSTLEDAVAVAKWLIEVDMDNAIGKVFKLKKHYYGFGKGTHVFCYEVNSGSLYIKYAKFVDVDGNKIGLNFADCEKFLSLTDKKMKFV